MKSQILSLFGSLIIFVQGLIALSLGAALCYTRSDELFGFVVLALDKGYYLIFGAVLVSGLYATILSGYRLVEAFKKALSTKK